MELFAADRAVILKNADEGYFYVEIVAVMLIKKLGGKFAAADIVLRIADRIGILVAYLYLGVGY